MSKKVIGVGAPLVDILASVSEEYIAGIDGDKGGMVMVEHDQQQQMLSELSNLDMAPGGSASNTIIGLLNLGTSGALLGKLGNDERA
ncbi:MAG: adenosine kinase, partial [Lentisphaeraceae bacterium]|nr:adenosine kinase [Lentisphaeraceae bacterium]